ncbi:DeoR/GlpR family DNA-binding transcription regulator [Corynebacterium callunae]|uniref:DeoR/GlpR family DNA-binding transcription regulator n=1 Tax=Corynebacterium callunae TaxID=1721 RepID=UPI0039819B89
MSQTTRQQTILALLLPTGRVSVVELAQHFNVTSETIRRDLRIMESLGLVQRVHGGAITPEPNGTSPPTLKPVQVPGLPPSPAMLNLAETAAQLIEPQVRSIFLDAGLSCTALATVLGDPPENARWTVVTNSPGAVIALSDSGETTAAILGGFVHGDSQSIIGPEAVKMVSQLRADIAFVSVDAFDSRTGLSTDYPETIPIKKAMIANSRFTVAVLPSTEQPQRWRHGFASTADFDVLVTDSDDIHALPNQDFQVINP